MILALTAHGATFAMPIFGGVYRTLKKEAKKPMSGIDCYACEEPLIGDRHTQVDHLIPVSHRPRGRKEKTNNQSYLGIMCDACNSQKSDTGFLDYALENPQVARGLRKQAEQIKANPKLVHIADQQEALAEKASQASKRGWFG
jgi:hypothetical protein